MLWGFDCCFLYRQKESEKSESIFLYFVVFVWFVYTERLGEQSTEARHLSNTLSGLEPLLMEWLASHPYSCWEEGMAQIACKIYNTFPHCTAIITIDSSTLTKRWQKSLMFQRVQNENGTVIALLLLIFMKTTTAGLDIWTGVRCSSSVVFIKMTAVEFISQQRGNRRSG